MSTPIIAQNPDIHNRAQQAVAELRRRHPNLSIVEIARLLREALEAATNPASIERLNHGLAACDQIHRESPRAPHHQSSYPVSLAGLTRRDGRNWSTSGRRQS